MTVLIIIGVIGALLENVFLITLYSVFTVPNAVMVIYQLIIGIIIFLT